jgi:hypothetical protein
MAEDIAKAFEEDLGTVDAVSVTGENDNERVMKLCAHALLRIWTRMTIETGQRLEMTPYQFSLGIYKGQMNWTLNEALNFKELPQIEMSGNYGRRHALLVEGYEQKDESRVRIVFALEEEEVKGKPVAVNYLVYDAGKKDFSFAEAIEALSPALPPWFETVRSRSDGPIWEFCTQKLECVGV